MQQVNERLIEQVPALRAKQRRIEHECQRSIEKGEAQRVWRKLITLPVIVHVVYKTDEENISDEQVQSQIDVLNADYSATNADKDKVPEPWTSLAADPNIQFELKEITRTETERDSFGTNDTVKRSSDGGVNPRPTTEVPQHLGLQPRRGPARLRAVPRRPGRDRRRGRPLHRVRHHRRGGRAVQPRPHRDARGRPLAQPAPHLGRHDRLLAAPTRCPTRRGRRCPTTARRTWPHISCNNGPNGDMFMNYMDYVDDAAMFMFTQGQAARINATLAGPRKKIAGL